MQNYLVFHTAASGNSVNECQYALLKLLEVYNLQPPPQLNIVLYTQQPVAFEAYLPFFKNFELNETGNESIHKISLLQSFLDAYGGNVLYADPDTYPLQPLGPLFQQIADNKWITYNNKPATAQTVQKLNNMLAGYNTANSKTPFAVEDSFTVHKAAVLGTNPQQLPLITKIAALYEGLQTSFRKDIAEDLAISTYLDKYDQPIFDAEQFIGSYCYFHDFKKILQVFFQRNEEESIPNLVKRVHHLDAKNIEAEKKEFDRQSFVKKIVSALTGKAWSVRQYQNKF
jgi:hypothetical protein